MANMDFIQKDVNKGLLIFLIALIVVLAGLEVFYALNFKSINKDYDAKINELNKTYNDLINYQNVLNKTKSELQVKSQREEGLSLQYTDVKTQKDELLVERDKLSEDNKVLKQSLSLKEDQLGTLTTKYQALNRTYYSQRTQIEGLNVQVSNLQGQLAQCQAQ